MRRCEFELAAEEGAADFDGQRGRWHVTEPCPVFDLVPLNGRVPSGWVLIEGRLLRHGDACAAELLVFDDDRALPAARILLPVLLNGRIHEIVRLPQRVVRLRWRPISSNGWFEQPSFAMRALGWWECRWRMAERVIDTLIAQPREACKSYGLTPWRLIADLPGAYQAATQFRISSHQIVYRDWVARFDTLQASDRAAIRRAIRRRLPNMPHFRLWIAATDKGESLKATLSALRLQLYRNFSVTIFTLDESAHAYAQDLDVSSLGVGGRMVECHEVAAAIESENCILREHRDGDWVMVLRAGDVLAEHALFWFAKAACDHRDAALIYSDDDVLDEQGGRNLPRFKPDWSPEHLRSANYIGDAVCVRSGVVAAIGGIAEDCLRLANDDLLLRISEKGDPKVIHVPAVLLHRQARPLTERIQDYALAVRANHLQRLGASAAVTPSLPGCFRVRYDLRGCRPMVSIIVPTRDRLQLLKRCVESVLRQSTYENFELIVVDNGSSEPETLAYLSGLAAEPKVRVLRDDGPFNFSALNNRAVSQSAGEVICLLNNDTELISPDWMEEMLSHLLRDGVGAVGAKLYFPDGRLQHAGDAVGPGGCADHLHGVLNRDDPGYCNRAMLAQEVSAVTGACLMTHRWLYERLGGLDEVLLKVAFNDVDYCLRVRAAGYRVIFTPYAELYHYESASRGRDDSPEKQRRTRREADQMRKRWKARMKHDPYYNPNLNYRRPDFSLGNSPRVVKPWF